MDSEDLDSEQTAENLYRQEFELLKGMFEDHFSSEVIAGVLEDCYGDVNLAVDTLTKIEDSSDSSAVNVAIDTPNSTNVESSTTEVPECNNSNMAPTNGNSCLNEAPSYAAAAFKGPLPITAPTPTPVVKRHRPKNVMPKVDYWSEEMKTIVRCHNEGSRVLVVMRGAPGSGKSYLARVIVECTVGVTNPNVYEQYIFSADDFMVTNGEYHYNRHRLSECHIKNQSRVHRALNQGQSPVIVDNTHMLFWEMYPYIKDAVRCGYTVEIVEPSNPWSKDSSQLAKRNIHGVPKEKIEFMLQKYEGHCTGDRFLKYYNLYYTKDMKPPVLRKIPPFITQSPLEAKLFEKLESVSESVVNQIHQNNNPAAATQYSQVRQNDNSIMKVPSSTSTNNDISMNESSIYNKILNQKEIEKNFDELLKVEAEWDNGDKWDSVLSNQTPKVAVTSSSAPKPQRAEFTERSDKFIEPSMINDDWSKNLMFMEPMHNNTSSEIQKKDTSKIQAQTGTISTVKDVSNNDEDTNMMENNNNNNNDLKDKILNQQVLNNNISAQNSSFSSFHVCAQEDKYFINLRKMFKNIPRPVLREIYDKCAGDGNWACSIVLDGIRSNTIQTVDTDLSDSEDEVHVECQCEERNSVIPGIPVETTSLLSVEDKPPMLSPTIKKKPKKEKSVTEESSQVLQNIKKSIQISDNHYSQYCLNLKKSRYDSKEDNDQKACKSTENPSDAPNANSPQNVDLDNISIPGQSNVTLLPDFSSASDGNPGTSQKSPFRDIPTTSSANTNYAMPTDCDTKTPDSTDADDDFEEDDFYDLGSEDDRSTIDDKRNITVNIGMEFVRRLDELYGRHDFEYPAGVKPVLSIPNKILYDLNALWVESVTHQLDADHTQTEEMIKQDEDFAREVQCELQLEAEAELPLEEENACALTETRVHSFKEIMDTELALAIYEKEIRDEWKTKEPQDLAAQMTRKKLYELFPDVAPETLSELLIAHDNSFDATVEILMISTGQGHYLDQTNGVNKFVMEKENENKEKALQAVRTAALSEKEYPYLFKPGEQTELTMDSVNRMREKAEQHKNERDRYHQKARWFYDRKKFTEASFYSLLASLHTGRYETASSYAAAALVQYHANIHPEANVIDLHFLRVSEAEVSLELFIDDRLRKMRHDPEKRYLVLRIITGRGKHSPGRPRVKPAIMRLLKTRGLSFRQLNPGLLEARLKPTHLLTDEFNK